MERERLINAEVFEKFIKEKYADGEKAEDIKEQMLFDLSCQPTVYDVDAVVEQLEERTAFLKDCTKYGNKTADQQSKSYDTMMMYEVMDLVDDLLEIVKAGVSDGN